MRGRTICGLTLSIAFRKRAGFRRIEAYKAHGASARPDGVAIDHGDLVRTDRIGAGRRACRWRTRHDLWQRRWNTAHDLRQWRRRLCEGADTAFRRKSTNRDCQEARDDRQCKC
jgi:hypothetical protein